MISVRDLSIRAGSFALDGISFEIPTGGYGILMGKTGCGKTTILEAICGLKSVVSGSIRLMSKEVVGLRPADRGIGFVPQDGALFSTSTIRQHLAFSLEIRKQSRRVIEKRVGELSEMLGLGHLLERRPQGLSGGERQRVALGRALAFEPGILCLDEPLSALDEDTRRETCDLLASVREKTGVTTLHITHSLWEARKLADRVLVLEDGVISQRPADDSQVSTEAS